MDVKSRYVERERGKGGKEWREGVEGGREGGKEWREGGREGGRKQEKHTHQTLCKHSRLKPFRGQFLLWLIQLLVLGEELVYDGAKLQGLLH